MTQYLLALHAAGEFPDLPFEDWKQSYADCGAADLDVALEWAKLATAACRVPIEVSPFDERDIDTLLAAFPK